MYVNVKKQTRPNVDVKFFDIRNEQLVSKEYRDYWRLNYVMTNKCSFVVHSLSSDQLVLSSTMLWKSKAHYDEFIQDEFSLTEFLYKFRDYNTKNNIITEIVSEEEL